MAAKKFVTSAGNSLNLTSDVTNIVMESAQDGIVLGEQEDRQWAFVSNDRMNVEEAIVDGIIATREIPTSLQTDTDIYDIQGRKLAAPQRGINIIRHSDGRERKVLVK